jgi:enamine deaminase RidA (YjgF/YER057c/UK114 family)
MKSTTYASLVTIVFVVHRNHIATSIDGALREVDALCEELGLSCDLSHMTKYRIVSDMLKHKILVTRKTKKNKKLRLSKQLRDRLE